jgi:hypothetical protein
MTVAALVAVGLLIWAGVALLWDACYGGGGAPTRRSGFGPSGSTLWTDEAQQWLDRGQQ